MAATPCPGRRIGRRLAGAGGRGPSALVDRLDLGARWRMRMARKLRCSSTDPIHSVRDVDAYVLTVRFEKGTTNRCLVTAWARDRKPFPVSHMAGASRMPHDLATFVIEQSLSIAGG